MATAVRYNGPSTSATIRASDGNLYTCPNGSQITVPDDTAIALFAEGWTAPDGSTPGFTPPGPNVVEEVFLVNGALSKHAPGGGSSTVPVSTGGATLTRTTVKTAAYTAAVGELVPCDPTSGAFTITLPAAPADKAIVEVKIVAAAAPNPVPSACAGSDVLNRAGGPTTMTLGVAGHGATLQYDVTTHIWTVTSSDTPLAQLDTRYSAVTRVVALGNMGATPTLALTSTDRDVLVTGTLTANATLTVTGLTAGVSITLVLTQDATGSRTFVFSPTAKKVGGQPLPFSTTAGAVDVVAAFSPDGTNLYAFLSGRGMA